MTLRLKILSRAQLDAQCIFDYLAERSPQGAVDWWGAFETAAHDAASGLVEYSLAPENAGTNLELRHTIFKTRAGRRYRFVYTISANELRILRVRGPGQPALMPEEIDPSRS